MIETLFGCLYDAMTGGIWLALLASFGWGLLSILLSPCHLSSIPLIIGYITKQGNTASPAIFRISLIFAVGILITIGLVGIVTASAGRLMGDLGNFGNLFVAAIFIIVGLYLLDLISLNWSGFGVRSWGSGALGALVLGLIFGLALGPCTFAFMAPVLGLVFDTAREDLPFALGLMAAFAVGHCAVIVGAGTLTGRLQRYLDWSGRSKTLLILRKSCGLLVIAGGIYLVYLNF